MSRPACAADMLGGFRCLGLTLLLSSGLIGIPSSAHAASTTRISVDSGGNEPNGPSYSSQTSADGRWVAYTSPASNLVAGDTNGVTDAFLHDRQSGTTTRVSVSSASVQGNDISLMRSISADGRRVAFVSRATNLVAGDTNGTLDLFVHDRVSGVTERISVADDGAQANNLSEEASLSENGRLVAFRSAADNLVPGDTNNRTDVFLRDLDNASTVRVSLASDGSEGNGDSRAPSLSADGQFVAFQSTARNLVADDLNVVSDVFVHALGDGSTRRVSTGSGGEEGVGASTAPSINADGSRVAFESLASNLVADDLNGDGDTDIGQDVFVHRVESGTTQRVSLASDGTEANGSSERPVISADGQRVAFDSRASNLVADDTNGQPDVFVHALGAAVTTRVSVDSAGAQGNDLAQWPGVDSEARRVVFHAVSNNLVADDTNGSRDVFLHDRGADCDVTAVQHRFALPSNQWVTLALPCEPPAGTTIADLFGDDIAGDYVTDPPSPAATWVVYTYDPTAAVPDYVNPGIDGELAVGQGFWIIQRTGATVTLDLPEGSRGVATDFSAGAACLGSAGCAGTQLSGAPTIPPDRPLWNLLGNPFNVIVQHDDVRVTTASGACSGAGCSLTAAYALPVENRVAYDVLFHFNGDSYQSILAGSEILPWQGFWFGELVGASANLPVLHLPEERHGSR